MSLLTCEKYFTIVSVLLTEQLKSSGRSSKLKIKKTSSSLHRCCWWRKLLQSLPVINFMFFLDSIACYFSIARYHNSRLSLITIIWWKRVILLEQDQNKTDRYKRYFTAHFSRNRYVSCLVEDDSQITRKYLQPKKNSLIFFRFFYRLSNAQTFGLESNITCFWFDFFLSSLFFGWCFEDCRLIFD